MDAIHNEMEDILAAIDQKTTSSLRTIKLIFMRCGQSVPSNFKQHFLQALSNRWVLHSQQGNELNVDFLFELAIDSLFHLFSTSIKLTYEQFEIDSLFQEPMDDHLDSVASVAESLSNDGQIELKSETSKSRNLSFTIDGLDDDEVVIEAFETGPADFGVEVERPSLFEESMNVNNSIANVVGGSSNSGQSGLKSEASNSQDDVIQIDDSDDDEDAIKVENDTPSNVDPHDIESDTIVTQNTSDANNE